MCARHSHPRSVFPHMLDITAHYSSIQAFPNMYLWNTYGLVCALEKIWEFHQPSLTNTVHISPYVIEISAALERALAMAYTGDARVITSDIMKPFGLQKSLIEHGLPCIAVDLTFDQSLAKNFIINPANWPVNKLGEPAVASKRTQILTYGESHYIV